MKNKAISQSLRALVTLAVWLTPAGFTAHAAGNTDPSITRLNALIDSVHAFDAAKEARIGALRANLGRS